MILIRFLVYMFLLMSILMTMPAISKAGDVKQFGTHKVFYSAFRSDDLTPMIAKEYSIERKNNRIVINISLHDKDGNPARGNVKGYATNLSLQLKILSFREILDGSAVYYIAQTKIANEETLTFNVKVVPLGEKYTGRINFKQKFYSN